MLIIKPTHRRPRGEEDEEKEDDEEEEEKKERSRIPWMNRPGVYVGSWHQNN